MNAEICRSASSGSIASASSGSPAGSSNRPPVSPGRSSVGSGMFLPFSRRSTIVPDQISASFIRDRIKHGPSLLVCINKRCTLCGDDAFDWDAGNQDHVLNHGVEPGEGEEAL